MICCCHKFNLISLSLNLRILIINNHQCGKINSMMIKTTRFFPSANLSSNRYLKWHLDVNQQLINLQNDQQCLSDGCFQYQSQSPHRFLLTTSSDLEIPHIGICASTTNTLVQSAYWNQLVAIANQLSCLIIIYEVHLKALVIKKPVWINHRPYHREQIWLTYQFQLTNDLSDLNQDQIAILVTNCQRFFTTFIDQANDDSLIIKHFNFKNHILGLKALTYHLNENDLINNHLGTFSYYQAGIKKTKSWTKLTKLAKF